jgi:hypothetical protein
MYYHHINKSFRWFSILLFMSLIIGCNKSEQHSGSSKINDNMEVYPTVAVLFYDDDLMRSPTPFYIVYSDGRIIFIDIDQIQSWNSIGPPYPYRYIQLSSDEYNKLIQEYKNRNINYLNDRYIISESWDTPGLQIYSYIDDTSKRILIDGFDILEYLLLNKSGKINEESKKLAFNLKKAPDAIQKIINSISSNNTITSLTWIPDKLDILFLNDIFTNSPISESSPSSNYNNINILNYNDINNERLILYRTDAVDKVTNIDGKDYPNLVNIINGRDAVKIKEDTIITCRAIFPGEEYWQKLGKK